MSKKKYGKEAKKMTGTEGSRMRLGSSEHDEPRNTSPYLDKEKKKKKKTELKRYIKVELFLPPLTFLSVLPRPIHF